MKQGPIVHFVLRVYIGSLASLMTHRSRLESGMGSEAEVIPSYASDSKGIIHNRYRDHSYEGAVSK